MKTQAPKKRGRPATSPGETLIPCPFRIRKETALRIKAIAAARGCTPAEVVDAMETLFRDRIPGEGES